MPASQEGEQSYIPFKPQFNLGVNGDPFPALCRVQEERCILQSSQREPCVVQRLFFGRIADLSNFFPWLLNCDGASCLHHAAASARVAAQQTGSGKRSG